MAVDVARVARLTPGLLFQLADGQARSVNEIVAQGGYGAAVATALREVLVGLAADGRTGVVSWKRKQPAPSRSWETVYQVPKTRR